MCGKLREVSGKSLILLAVGSLREVCGKCGKLLILLREECGAYVPIYYVYRTSRLLRRRLVRKLTIWFDSWHTVARVPLRDTSASSGPELSDRSDNLARRTQEDIGEAAGVEQSSVAKKMADLLEKFRRNHSNKIDFSDEFTP